MPQEIPVLQGKMANQVYKDKRAHQVLQDREENVAFRAKEAQLDNQDLQVYED